MIAHDGGRLYQARRIATATGYTVEECYRALVAGRTETQIVDAKKRNLPASGGEP